MSGVMEVMKGRLRLWITRFDVHPNFTYNDMVMIHIKVQLNTVASAPSTSLIWVCMTNWCGDKSIQTNNTHHASL